MYVECVCCLTTNAIDCCFAYIPSCVTSHLYYVTTALTEGFLDMLTKAQSSRIDDQRGLSIDVTDLPEFLKSGSSDQQSETDEGSISPPQSQVNTGGAHSLTASAHR